MFFDRHFDQASGALDSLLESGDATFFTVVLDASVVQEVGMDSTNVVQFLTSNENLTKLLEFALDPVSCEVQVAEDSNYELPEDTTIGELSLRCHNILSALNLDLLSAIGKNESHLAYIFSRLPNKTSKESIPAIFHITTVLHNILSHTPQDIVAYIKENPGMTLEVLLANLNISDIIPIMELLVTFEVDVTRWLVQEAYLVERLRKVLCTKALCEQNIAKEDSGGGKMFAEHFEVQVNALRFIMTLLDLTTGSEQAIRAEPLVQELVSPVFMKCLLYEGVSSMHSSVRYISWLVPCIEKILSLWKQQTQNSKSPANLTTHLLPDLKATTPENEALGIGLVHHCKVNSNMGTSESRRLCGMARVQLYQLASILAEYGAGAFLLTHHVDTCAVQCLFAFPNHSILLCTITRLLTTLLEYPQEDIARSTWNRCQEGLSQWIAGDLNNANRRTTSGGHALELTTVLLGMIKRFHIAEDELPEPVQIYLETTYAKCISLQKEPLLGIVAKSCRGAIDLDDLEEAETNVLQLQDPFQLTRFQSSKQEHHNEPHHVDPVSLIDQESEKKDVDIWSVALNTATPGEKIEDGARQDASNGSPLKRTKPDDQNCVAGKNSSVYFKGQNNQHENVLQAVQFRDPFAIDFSSEKPDGFTAASDSLGVDFMGGGTDPLSSSSSEDEFDVVFRSGPSSPRIDAPTTLQQDPISVLNSEVSPDTHFPDDPLSFLDQTSGTNKILERVTQNERLNLGTGVGSPRLRLGCATQAPQGQLSKSGSNSPKATHGKQDRIPNETDHSLLGFEPHTSKKIFTDSTHSKLNFKESTPRDTDNAKRNVAQSLEDLLAANLDALFNTTYPVDTQKKNKPKTPLHQSVTGNAHVHDSSQLPGHPNAEAMQIHDNAVPDWFNIAANGTSSSSPNHLNAMSSVDQKLPSSHTGPHFLTAADLWSVSSTYSNNSGAVSPGLFEDIISSGMTITNELNVNTSQKPDDFLGNFDECTMTPKAPSFTLQEDPLDKWVHFTDG